MPTAPLPIVVMISGRGSNLGALLANSIAYRVISVVSDNPEAQGLNRAQESGVPTAAFPRANYATKALQKQAIYEAIEALNPGLIVLAGFMQLLEKDFVTRHFGRIINIHPSLLPAFPGLHTHERVAEALAQSPGTVRAHGATVHYVDSGMDTGPIIAQAKVPVFPNDTADTLAARVLAREHEIYPWVVHTIARGGITLTDRKVHYDARTREEAAQRDFLLTLTA